MQNKTTPFDSLTYDQVSAILQAKANGFKGVTKNNTIIKDYNKEFTYLWTWLTTLKKEQVVK